MKIIRLYEVKLINGEVYRGEIALHNKKGIYLRLNTGKVVYIFYHSITVIKDLGWKKLKRK